MNEKIVFVRTSSGEDEARSRTAHLSKDIKRALLMVDGAATVAEIMKRSSPSLRGMLEDMFAELVRGGFIQDKSKVARPAKLVTPPAAPRKPADDVDELDFTAAYRVPTQAELAEEAAKVRLAAERAAAEAERARRDDLERARMEQEAQARARAEREAAEAAARLEAERQAREAAAKQAELAENKARAAAEERARLEAEVAKLKAQAEARAAAERQARLDAEAERRELVARARAEQEAAEAAARLDAERHVKEALDAARKAEQEAARAEAQAAEEKIRLEAEVAALKAQAEAQARARIDAEMLAKQEIEAARARAEQEASRVREEAAQARQRAADEARARADAERIAREAEAARQEALREAERTRLAAQQQAELVAREEAARVKAEQEASRVREEAAQARQRAADEARADAERIAREAEAARQEALHEAERTRLAAQQQAELVAREEAARLKAEQEAARVKAEQETERIKSEQQAAQKLQESGSAASRQFSDAESLLPSADESTGVSRRERRVTPAAVQGCDSRGGNNGVPVVERRTSTAAVVFYDIVGYTKQSDNRQIELKQLFSQLLNSSLSLLGSGERISLDTGDGAAVGFLQHPTDALESAIHFRDTLMAGSRYSALRVRIGIHLGPVSLVKDMNGQINMLGDGINSAQRVMSFAGPNLIYVSRAYFDFVSNLGDEYDNLFRYRGSQQDKHGREFQIYELTGEGENEPVPAHDNPDAFSFEAFDALLPQTAEQDASVQEECRSSADQLLLDAAGLGQADTAESAERVEVAPAVVAQADSYSEQEARQLADEQAEKWAEAERRAAELAAKKPEYVAPEVAVPPAHAVAVRVHRKSLPWGKLVAGALVLLLLLLAVIPAVMPTQGYLTGMEQLLGSKLQQPVHIGHLAGRILPTPRLVLEDVSIGEARQIQVRQARVNFSFAALWGAVKPVDRLDLDEVRIGSLPEVSGWLQQLAGDRQYPVANITLAKGQLDADGMQLTGVDGELNFDHAGRFSVARLNGLEHKLELDIHATPAQKLEMSIKLRDSALPSLPDWLFDELNATGELARDELRITDLNGRIRGGGLSGEVRINWRSGWRVQGVLVAKALPLQNINKLLDGDMNGTAHFQMQSASLGKLADTATMNAVFSVGKGVIGGVDLVEITRLHSRESLPGGRTHFDALSGELSYANDVYRFSRLKISDSMVKATGSLTVARQQLSGQLSADLTMRTGSAALQIDGSTGSPSLHVAH